MTSIPFKVLRSSYQELIIGVTCLFAYTPVILWMQDRWFARDSYYSHGFLMPMVTLYLIWQKMPELKKIHREPTGWGSVLIFSGILTLLFSAFFRIYFIAGFSMLIVLVGLILGFYGKNILRKILFPILFLVFMIPLPEVMIAEISFHMKIFAAKIATYALNNYLHFQAAREGSLIKMAHNYVMVDDVCSGLRSLIALLALGSLCAYWFKGPHYKKAILFLSAIPIAVLTNVFRIIFLCSIAEIWGSKYAVGFAHTFSGFLVFALALVLLLAVAKLLE